MAEELSPIASILTGNDPAGEDESPDTPPTPDPVQETELSASTADEVEPTAETPPATLTVKQIAERLETTPKALYESLQIDIGGKSISLSEVKDRGKDLFGAEQTLTDSDAYRLAAENDILRSNQALTLRAEKLGGNVTEAELAESQQLHNEYVTSERERALLAIPGWSNPTVQQAEVKLVSDMLTEFGFSPHEISNKLDHRDIKIYREYAVLKDRLAQVSDTEVRKLQQQKPKGKPKSAPTTKSAQKRYQAGEISQTQAVLRAIADGAKK